jgi:hypothetical protein
VNPSDALAVIHGALAIVGAVYVLLSTIGAVAPNTKVGQVARVLAADLNAFGADSSGAGKDAS